MSFIFYGNKCSDCTTESLDGDEFIILKSITRTDNPIVNIIHNKYKIPIDLAILCWDFIYESDFCRMIKGIKESEFSAIYINLNITRGSPQYINAIKTATLKLSIQRCGGSVYWRSWIKFEYGFRGLWLIGINDLYSTQWRHIVNVYHVENSMTAKFTGKTHIKETKDNLSLDHGDFILS